MTFDIRARKDEDEKQTSSQRDENADESKNCQKSKQILMVKFENRKDIFQNDNNDVVTSLSDNVDYVKLAAKKKAKTKNLKVKKEYLILQKKNK